MAMPPADLSPTTSPKTINRQTTPSPWTQVVRGGGEPETASPRSPSSDWPSGEVTEGQSADDNALKKSAWKAVNGAVAEGPGPVMGTAWPTISESTRSASKSSSSSCKPVPDGSVSASQVYLSIYNTICIISCIYWCLKI